MPRTGLPREHASNRAQFGAQGAGDARLVGHVHGPPDDQAAIPVHLGLRVWFAFEIGEADPVSTPPDQWIQRAQGLGGDMLEDQALGHVM